MKVLIFDSGTLITLSMNNLLDMLRDLKKIFPGKFIITKEVENEIVLRPLRIQQFKLGAIRLRKLIQDKILEFPDVLNIRHSAVSNTANELLKEANSIFIADGNPVHIVDQGEASILALNKLLQNRGIKSMIAIDERTTRMLCERPENLRKLLENKLHTRVKQQKQISKDFHKASFIRSTELIYVAYKKGIVPKDKELLDAMLYGAKFKGASISSDEINEIERMA